MVSVVCSAAIALVALKGSGLESGFVRMMTAEEDFPEGDGSCGIRSAASEPQLQTGNVTR